MIRDAWVLFVKDLVIEARTRERVAAMALFAFIVLVTFGFAFDPARTDLRPVFAGLVWVEIFLAGQMGIARSFAVERDTDVLTAIRLTPVDPMAVIVAKLMVNGLLLLVVEAVAVPLSFSLFHVPPQLPVAPFLLVMALTTLGFLVSGTLLSAISLHLRMGELLLPLFLFPLMVPIVLGGVQSLQLLLAGHVGAAYGWLRIIVAYDALFLALSLWLSDSLWEV